MALHQRIQRLLLLGVHLHQSAPPPHPRPPPPLLPLIESLAAAHRRFDQRAIHFGHRYRSGFWAIYLLSALAVLFAILPLALGWDSPTHALHPYSGLWALGEVGIIGTVSAIYWLGVRGDWQGEWLRTRTTAELTWYLPLLAPLLDFSQPATEANWYLRVMDPAQHLSGADDVALLCAQNEVLARTQLAAAWNDPGFSSSYAQWHSLTTWLFGLTALGALTHLLLHSLWLSLVTTFFPALGASLHGALAQSEAYRLSATSERLVVELQGAIDNIEAARSLAVTQSDSTPLKAAIQAAIALILEEHQDWHMLVRPHQMPLA